MALPSESFLVEDLPDFDGTCRYGHVSGGGDFTVCAWSGFTEIYSFRGGMLATYVLDLKTNGVYGDVSSYFTSTEAFGGFVTLGADYTAELLHETAESLWTTTAAGTPLSLEARARIRAAAVWATNRATEVVTSAYRAGGGSSIYAASPLQRRLRDVNALTQHFLVRNDTLTTAGAILAGQDVSVMVF